MDKNILWKKIRIFGILSFIFPLLLLITGIILSNKGFTGMVENYEEGAARFIQYIIFAAGAGIFFFCDGISDSLSRSFFAKPKKDRVYSYFLYALSTLWLLNIISITGFIGFLICGNLTWLAVFVILNLSIGIRYLPSHKRMQKLLGEVK
ncbi:MAG TPA: hypothetical protein PLE69_05250 [bacterium]|nr:hypothetical protein [bacterium]